MRFYNTSSSVNAGSRLPIPVSSPPFLIAATTTTASTAATTTDNGVQVGAIPTAPSSSDVSSSSSLRTSLAFTTVSPAHSVTALGALALSTTIGIVTPLSSVPQQDLDRTSSSLPSRTDTGSDGQPNATTLAASTSLSSYTTSSTPSTRFSFSPSSPPPVVFPSPTIASIIIYTVPSQATQPLDEGLSPVAEEPKLLPSLPLISVSLTSSYSAPSASAPSASAPSASAPSASAPSASAPSASAPSASAPSASAPSASAPFTPAPSTSQTETEIDLAYITGPSPTPTSFPTPPISQTTAQEVTQTDSGITGVPSPSSTSALSLLRSQSIFYAEPNTSLADGPVQSPAFMLAPLTAQVSSGTSQAQTQLPAISHFQTQIPTPRLSRLSSVPLSSSASPAQPAPPVITDRISSDIAGIFVLSSILSSISSSSPTTYPPRPVVANSPAIAESERVGPSVFTIGLPSSPTSGVGYLGPDPKGGTSVPASSRLASHRNTAIITGSIVGGLAFILLAVALLWWSRKRLLKKRYSTLLNPLTISPGYGEKFGVDNPAFAGTTLRAGIPIVHRKHRNLSSRESLAGVQYVQDGATMSSNVAVHTAGTNSDRLVPWWAQLPTDIGIPWSPERTSGSRVGRMTLTRPRFGKVGGCDSQPASLKSLNVDIEGPFSQGSSRPPSKQSGHVIDRRGSIDRSLRSLKRDLDSITMPHGDTISAASGAMTSAADIKSGTAAISTGSLRSSNSHQLHSFGLPYHDETYSVGAFTARHNKSRSDPFDLDRSDSVAKSRKSSINRSLASGAESDTQSALHQQAPTLPTLAVTNFKSIAFPYSTSIGGMGDWTDPGPDVGPAATRWRPTEYWSPFQDNPFDRKPPEIKDGSNRIRGGFASGDTVGKAL